MNAATMKNFEHMLHNKKISDKMLSNEDEAML